MAITKLTPEMLTADQDFSFNLEKSSDPLMGLIDQDKAVKSIDFGLNLKSKGYNVYVSGISGSGRTTYVLNRAKKSAENEPASKDWIYVSDFKNLGDPIALKLETGTAEAFKQKTKKLIETIKIDFNKRLRSNEYEKKKQSIISENKKIAETIISELNSEIKPLNFVFIQTEKGLISVPAADGKPMTKEEYAAITDEKILSEIRENSEKVAMISVDYFNKLREQDAVTEKNIEDIQNTLAESVVDSAIKKFFEIFPYGEDAQKHLNNMRRDILENIGMFIHRDSPPDNIFGVLGGNNSSSFFERYKVNAFISRGAEKHAPIVFESNPTFSKLIGQIEFVNKSGIMVTDLTHIKPGALHKANGGYLILHAKDLLINPFSWQALKRALLDEHIAIEPITGNSHISALNIRPQPIPLNVKVILIGNERYYQALFNNDESFRKLFKIKAGFEVEMDANQKNTAKLYQYINKYAEENDLKTFDISAVRRVTEYTKRLADNKNKLSTQLSKINNILIQADAWARIENKEKVLEEDVVKALEEAHDRLNAYQENILEMFKDGTYLIDVSNRKVGEINGLAVITMGDYSFGKPSRISCTTFVGTEGVVSIERESASSGRIHDKGLMTIYGYLGGKYAQDKPLSLTAVIAFEQLYSGIDGDSASSTELYCLLSSLSEVPIYQGLAVTGSVNQRGEIQPIGGVNDKIEGFFKVCKIKGTYPEQGVIIPRQNIQNLMLSDEVIEAVKNSEFNIYAIDTIDDGIEILTGKRSETIHGLVNAKLNELRYLGTKPKN